MSSSGVCVLAAVQCRNPPTGRNVTRTFKGSLTLPAVFNYTESVRAVFFPAGRGGGVRVLNPSFRNNSKEFEKRIVETKRPFGSC